MAEFKKINEVDIIEAVKENLNVLAEDNGDIVRISANNLVPEDVVTSSELAEAIAAIPEPITSWNDLTDRPFEVINCITPNHLKDGSWANLPSFNTLTGDINAPSSGPQYMCISEYTPSLEEIQKAKVLHASNGKEQNMSNIMTFNQNVNCLANGWTSQFIVAYDTSIEIFHAGKYWPFTVPKPGIYSMSPLYQVAFSIEGITFKTEVLPTAVPVVQSATVGQTVAVKSVDENGKPTEWEAIEPNMLTDTSGGKWKLNVSTEGVLSATKIE